MIKAIETGIIPYLYYIIKTNYSFPTMETACNIKYTQAINLMEIETSVAFYVLIVLREILDDLFFIAV